MFNARKSAISREYIYYFTNEDIPVYLTNYVAQVENEIDLNEFNLILKNVVGEHDFSAFKKSGSNEFSTIRTIFQAHCD